MISFRLLFITAAIVFLPLLCLAQQPLQDVVYFKNGSIIRGAVLEQIQNQTIKIQTVDGSVYVYQMNDVVRITKEPPFNATTPDMSTGSSASGLEQRIGIRDASSGYTQYIKVGVGFPFARYSRYIMASLHWINGMKVSKQQTIGIGLGIEKMSGLYLIPFYLNTQVAFFNRDFSPYAFANLGYSFGASEYFGFTGAGVILCLGIGAKAYLNSDVALTFDLGYRKQGGFAPNLDIATLCVGIAL